MLDDQIVEEIREVACALVESVLERNDYEDAEQAWKCLSWMVKFNIAINPENIILLADLRIVSGTFLTLDYYIQ